MNTRYPISKLREVIKQEREPVGTFDGDGLPVLGVTNINGITSTNNIASEDKSQYLRLPSLRFAYNPYRINVGSIGLSAQGQEGIVSPAYVVFATKEFVDPNYLLHYLKSREGNRQINFYGNRGSVRAALRFDDLCKVEIPLPSLEEQRRIVARIEELAARIEEARGLKREIHEHYDALCRSILADTSDGVPTLTVMRELVKLRELDITVSPEEVYWFAGVYSFGKGLFRGQRKRGTEFSYNRLTRLKTGNFVYPKLMAWEGAFAIVPPECDGLVVSPEFPVFEIDQQRVLPETLEVYFHIPSVWLAVSGASTGTNVRRRRLNPADFLASEIPLPPMKTQKRLREVKAKLDQINKLQSETSAELDALLPSILDKAFKGEL